VEHLGGVSPDAAARARQSLLDALASLETLPERARRLPGGVRELPVRFGAYGYAIRFVGEGEVVFVTRIRHGREPD
jgi:plasmid stabilization system protein ParE